MNARIYQKPKNAMQSGRALTQGWILEFEPTEREVADPMTGWAGSGDTRRQVKLTFATAQDAMAYADRNGIGYHVIPVPPKKLKIQAYADNFR